ncbi:MAG: penicillin-binding protein 2 [Ignavibacteriae bacterium HGW-Ignavibacteriae-2]|jgi:penicillin-binding protein 2|nr:MAG: penicillin-binding protein 2 [Ignavibacteriae bacterium HGW-Ignavibacteriae-2]
MDDNSFGAGIRKDILFYSIIIIFGLFSFRLFKMQILDNKIYQDQSEDNSIKAVTLRPPRGVLYDRNFQYLVSNKPAFTIDIVPSEFDTSKSEVLEKLISANSGYLKGVFAKFRGYPAYLPQKLAQNVGIETISRIEENKSFFKGISYNVELQRDYSFGVNGSHMFGYTREIDAKQLALRRGEYSMGDYIGNSGIEKTYEYLLRGQKGYEFYIVDSKQHMKGRYENGQNDVVPSKGYDLVLSIDREAQYVAEKQFLDKSGAVIAIEPETGEILAFVSSPEFNLDQLSSLASGKVWQKLTTDKDKPLFNRATMSSNPPGSTFKMITAIAALEEGVITPEFTINCSGGYQYGNRFFKCTHVHGTVNVISAIEKSCNTFFYQLILKIGLDKWAGYAEKFGFGKKTGVDIGEETRGILPDSKYFDKTYGKGKWTNGYLISLAIGQGNIITTPIQLAQYAALLANNGNSVQPHFLKGYIDENNDFIPATFKTVHTDISQKTLDIVRQGMFLVVQGAGTATHIRNTKYTIAGKTGTVQNPHGKDHALFVAFAPFDNPKIAVAVIVENAGFGSTHAAPIAKEVINAYLQKLEGTYESKVAEAKPEEVTDEN